jgi:hypothetical protein
LQVNYAGITPVLVEAVVVEPLLQILLLLLLLLIFE